MKMNLSRIYFCTGARNHDLLKVMENIPTYFEYDERVASFKALGFSKVSNSPVAICTTSGTAVSETVSAMLEAYYSEAPLVLITGDRPKKLHGTGSPQTVDHELLTRGVRRDYVEIPLKDLGSLTLEGLKFPVHINVLVDDTIPHEFKTHRHDSMEGFKSFIQKFSRPLFLFSHEHTSMRDFVHKFSEQELPFYAESLSGGRELSTIKTEKMLLSLFKRGEFDSIIKVGHTPLSKLWRLLEKSPLPVFSFDSRGLSGLSYGEILPWGSKELLSSSEFWKTIEGIKKRDFPGHDKKELHELIVKYPQSEISLFSQLQDDFVEDDSIYLGNSLVIRFFELTQNKKLHLFGNRGVNGIDGQLSSAMGVASGVKHKVYAILGDVTTFYDLSSLIQMPENLRLIIINNKGGRIFDMLNLDKRIVLEHDNNFKKITEGMGLTYSSDITKFGEVQVLELFPDPKETQSFLEEWNT